MIKVFGVGNVLLRDDGVGIEVCRQIKLDQEVKVYIGEIYVDDCLEEVEDNDYIMIIDAVCLNKAIGKVHFLSFEECLKLMPPKAFCHDMSLLYTLLLERPNIKGELIGIEVAEINYGEGLSALLAQKLPSIIEKINEHIKEISRRETFHA